MPYLADFWYFQNGYGVLEFIGIMKKHHKDFHIVFQLPGRIRKALVAIGIQTQREAMEKALKANY